MSAVRYPEMRLEILSALEALSDPVHQQRVWIDKQMPTPTYYDDLDANVHVLYDDTEVLPDPADAVGVFLADPEEAEAIRGLGAAFDPLLQELGNASDATYLADPRWPGVVAAAARALAVFRRNAGP